MDRNSVPWRGNFNAVITQFTASGDLDKRLFQENLDILINEGIDGVILAGCTGEFWALTREERISLFKWAKEVVKKRVPVIASISQMTAVEVSALAQAAQELNLDGVMLTPPAAVVPTDGELYAYIKWVADSCELPLLVYNIPRRVGVGMSPKFLASLADIDNVVGIKQSTGDFFELINTIRLAGDKLLVFAGRPINWGFPATVMGADGLVSSDDPQLLGRESIRLYKMAQDGKNAECQALQKRLIGVNEMTHRFGTAPAGLKAAMNLRGLPGGYPRLPIQSIEGKQLEQLTQSMRDLGLL